MAACVEMRGGFAAKQDKSRWQYELPSNFDGLIIEANSTKTCQLWLRLLSF